MRLTDFFDSLEGDRNAKPKTTPTIKEAKRKITAKDDPCWSGYQMVGTKNKNGKEVPNCVPKESISEEAQIEDSVDTVTVDVPLLLRLLEYAKEDAKTDMDLHHVTERLIALSKSTQTLTMQDYANIVSNKE